jgi:hypothetical protein
VAPNVLHIRVAAATYLDVHDPHHVTIAAAKLQRHHFHNVAQAVHFTYCRHCTVANLNSAPVSAYNKDVKHSIDADDHTDPCGLTGCSAYLLQVTGFDYTVASAFFAHHLVAVLDVLLGNSPCMAAANCSKLHHISLELTAHALAWDSFLVVQVASATSAWGIDAVVDCCCRDRRTYGLGVVADCRVAAEYFGYCYCCAFLK